MAEPQRPARPARRPRSRGPGVDGVLGTPDILDDLLLLGALEGKVVIGSMNRGGLQGASFELDDRFTAYDAAEIAAAASTAARCCTRIASTTPARWRRSRPARGPSPSSPSTGCMAMVEPFISTREGGRVVNQLDPDSTIKSVHIAAGLGASSAHTWLKLPVVDELERVMDATTLPTLLLGGDPQGDPQRHVRLVGPRARPARRARSRRRPRPALPARR